jgi:protein TIF31
MVSRATKHVFSRYLRKLSLLDVASCVAHLLNCFVGFKVNSSPKACHSDEIEDSEASAPAWTLLNPKCLQGQIGQEVFKRYRFRLNDEWWDQCRCIVLLREVCLKMGFQLKARNYTFEKAEIPVDRSPKSKKSNGTNGHKAEETTFYPEDILNVVPVVKEAPLKVI